MYLPIFQSLTVTDKEALISYSNQTYGRSTPEELESALNEILVQNPQFRKDWLTGLHADVVEHAIAIKSNHGTPPDSLLLSYLKSVEVAYSGLGPEPMPGIEGIINAGYDITKDHLMWIVGIDKKVQELQVANPDVPEKTLFGYVKDSFGLNVSLQDYVAVKSHYVPTRVHQEIRPYLEWFVRSASNFDRGHLSLDSMQKISDSLQKVGNPSPVPVGALYQIYKDLEIHPMHERDVCYWANSATRGRTIEKNVELSTLSL